MIKLWIKVLRPKKCADQCSGRIKVHFDQLNPLLPLRWALRWASRWFHVWRHLGQACRSPGFLWHLPDLLRTARVPRAMPRLVGLRIGIYGKCVVVWHTGLARED